MANTNLFSLADLLAPGTTTALYGATAGAITGTLGAATITGTTTATGTLTAGTLTGTTANPYMNAQQAQLGQQQLLGQQQYQQQYANMQYGCGAPRGAQQVGHSAPDAFISAPEGTYDEVHASVPRDMGLIALERYPNMYVALLRQLFEQQGIKFDTAMGAPPTMMDLQQQILGHWTLWEDMYKDTWELTQRIPRNEYGIRPPVEDIEAVFERDMTDALTRLMGALKARGDDAAA